MADSAEQPGGELNLESHLESLLGEIEATQHEVEARSPWADPQTQTETAESSDAIQTDVADSADETDIAEDATLESIAEIEADLGDLMEAICELSDPDIAHEPLVEAELPENSAEPDASADEAQAEPEISEDLASSIADEILSEPDAPESEPESAEPADADDGFGLGIDDIAESIEEMLSTETEPETEPQTETEAETETEPDGAFAQDTGVQAPEVAGEGEAEEADVVDAPSGDSLDDMLAAASEELLDDEVSNPAPISAPEPEAPAALEDDDEPETNPDIGSELIDAVEQLGDSLAGEAQAPAEESGVESDEASAGMVEIPGAAPASPAPSTESAQPEAEPAPTDAASETPDPEPEPKPEPEPAQATTEELIAPAGELAPPTGRLAPVIIAWRRTKRTLGPIASFAEQRIVPALAGAALAAGKPLREKPKSVRDTVGWIALYTAFLALCLWIFALGFRSPTPPDVGDTGVRIVNPDGAASASVP